MSTAGEAEPTDRVSPEPEVISPEPESEVPLSEISLGEPILIPEPVDETGGMNWQKWPEPEPEWDVSILKWNFAWPMHIYFIGSMYLLICITTIMFLIKSLCVLKPRGKGKLTFSLLVMTAFFSFLRGVFLVADPYGAFHLIPWLVHRILSSVCIPFLMSSFSIVLLVLLDTTKTTFGPPIFQKLSTITFITACYLTVVVTTDVVVFFNFRAKAMLVFCQCLFVLYGFVLSFGYFYVGYKIQRNCKSGVVSGGYKAVVSLVRVSFSSAILSAVISVTYSYSAFIVVNVYSTEVYVVPWEWWSIQTLIRAEEILVCILVLTVATRNVRKIGIQRPRCVCWTSDTQRSMGIRHGSTTNVVKTESTVT